MNNTKWIFCPFCENKTRNRNRKDTILLNYPLYSPKCKQVTRVKYDAEINSLKTMMESIEKQQIGKCWQQELMEDIKKAVDELISGIEYEDEFYTQLLGKMVVNDTGSFPAHRAKKR